MPSTGEELSNSCLSQYRACNHSNNRSTASPRAAAGHPVLLAMLLRPRCVPDWIMLCWLQFWLQCGRGAPMLLRAYLPKLGHDGHRREAWRLEGQLLQGLPSPGLAPVRPLGQLLLQEPDHLLPKPKPAGSGFGCLVGRLGMSL